MPRAGIVAAALALSVVVAAAAPAVRGCIRDTCRTQGKACATAFRDGKAAALEACGAKRKHDPCRQAVRRSVRDGVQACRASAQSCTQCCRRSAGACSVGVCGNGRIEAAETCDGSARGRCAGDCRFDCTCATTVVSPVCGNGTIELGEQCEPGNDPACPERCRDDCTCAPPALCGNGSIDGDEACDGVADAACPGECRPDCTCTPPLPPVCGNGVIEGREECESADDADCPGQCQSDCTCGACGDGVIQPWEECEPSQASICPSVCSELSCTCVSATTDECAAPRRLESLPAVDRQVVVSATTAPDDPLVECVAEPDPHGHSVWYAVTAPAMGRIRADTAGSTYDTVLLALTGACGELDTVACNDDGGTDRAQVDFPVTAGTDYLLDVMAYRGVAGGELRLEVSFRPCGDGVLQDGEACEPTIVGSCATGTCAEDCVCLTPVADECADATAAAPPIDVELAGDTATGNPADPQLECVVQPVNPALSAWFRFLAPHDGTVVADTTGSNYDTVLGVFTGACEALVPIACDDDVSLAVPTSQVSVPVSAGVVYTVLVTPYLNHAPGRLHVHVAYEDAR